MKTMILAAAAVLALGVGSAYAADSDGGNGPTATAEAWAAQNGQQTVPASVAQAARNGAGQFQVAGTAQSQPSAFNTYQGNGQG